MPERRRSAARARDGHAARLLDLVTASWTSQALYVAAELRLADHLREGPRTAESLAEASGTDAPSLARLLRALCAVEVCRERADGRFEVTEMGALLAADAPDSLRAWTLWWGGNLWPVWGHLLHSVRTGRSARSHLLGTGGFGHLERDPAAAAVFHRALRELTRLAARHVVAAYDFSAFRQVVDVGGGEGELLAAVLGANPAARGVLVDLPHALGGAARHLAERGLSGRFDLAAADFFGEVPAGADAYLLKSVLHDWADEDARRILETCRRAMTAPGARLLVVEQVLPDRRIASAVHRSLSRSDLTMLVAHAGRERTEREFRELVAAAGLRVVRVVPAGPTFSVIEAAAPESQRRRRTTIGQRTPGSRAGRRTDSSAKPPGSSQKRRRASSRVGKA